MTGGSRRDDEDLPIFDAFEPGDVATTDARRSPGRGPLGPARGAGLAAGVLVLLVVGIAVGGLSVVPDPSGTPTGSDDISMSPTTSTDAEGGACRPLRRGQFPAVTLAVRETNREVEGLFGFGYGFGRQTQEPGWLLPPAPRALVARPTDSFALSSGLGVCFRHAVVEYTATRNLPNANPAGMFQDDLVPSARILLLGGLPDGDWVVRVTIHFDTLATEPGGDLVTVTYFRILSGNGPFVTAAPTPTPDLTPFISPTVPCGSLVPTPDIGVSAFAGTAAPVAGTPDRGSVLPEVHARPGDPIRIIIDGEACAIDWNIALINVETGEATTVDRFVNPNDDPSFAAQNRWDVSGFGQHMLTADLHFPGGLSVVRSWWVIVDPFAVPALYLVGPDGTRFPASDGCGLGMHLSNGYERSDSCGSIGYAPGPEALRVQAYRAIHLDLPGWQILSWSAVCGRVTTVDTEQFDSPDGCGLGSGSSDSGDPLLDRPAFLLPPGDTVVQIGIRATDGAGNEFSVGYYAHVIVR